MNPFLFGQPGNIIHMPSSYNWAGETSINMVQTNRSTVLGDFVGTFNMDLYSNKGKMRVNGRGMKCPDDGTLAGVPVAFRVFQNPNNSGAFGWAAPIGAYMYFSNSKDPNGTFTKDATAGSPTDLDSRMTDMEVWSQSGGSYLYVTANSTKVYYLSSGGTWANIAPLTGGAAAMLCVFNNRMYVSSTAQQIVSWDASNTISTAGNQNTIIIGNANEAITFMRAAQNRIFIGTVNVSGGWCHVYVWDGVSTTTFDRIIPIQANGVLSCVVKNDVPYVMDTNGFLLQFNGATFDEIARLPVPWNKTLYDPQDNLNTRFIHPNGMTVNRGRINLLINNVFYESSPTDYEFMPSGWWEYDPEIGLYHKGTPSYTATGGTTITDYGQQRIAMAGALQDAVLSTNNSGKEGNIIMGAQYYTDNTTTAYGIFTNDTLNTTQKWGYIVSPEIYSQDVESMWGMMWVRYRKFLDSSDQIVCKYRSVVDIPTEAAITWTSTSTFTLTTATTYAVGDEVEIVRGTGSGKSAHISALSADLKTITLDDTFTGVTTGTALARFTKWTKLGTITPTSTTKPQFAKLSFPINNNDTKVQLKICMQFKGDDELEQVLVVEKTEVKPT